MSGSQQYYWMLTQDLPVTCSDRVGFASVSHGTCSSRPGVFNSIEVLVCVGDDAAWVEAAG